MSKAIFLSLGLLSVWVCFLLLLLFVLFFNEVPKAAGGVSIFPILSTYVSTYQFFSRVGKKRNLSAILNQLKRTVFVVRHPFLVKKNNNKKLLFHTTELLCLLLKDQPSKGIISKIILVLICRNVFIFTFYCRIVQGPF